MNPEDEAFSPVPAGNEEILFVDDEKALTDLGERVLSLLEYDVTARTSSMEALEAFPTARTSPFEI